MIIKLCTLEPDLRTNTFDCEINKLLSIDDHLFKRTVHSTIASRMTRRMPVLAHNKISCEHRCRYRIVRRLDTQYT
jgi:hypothetical protein